MQLFEVQSDGVQSCLLGQLAFGGGVEAFVDAGEKPAGQGLRSEVGLDTSFDEHDLE